METKVIRDYEDIVKAFDLPTFRKEALAMASNMLSIKQVADKLGVTIRTVYKHVKSGNLKAVKIGYLWRIRESDFEEFIRPKGGK